MYVYKYERLVKLSKSQGIPQGHSAQGLTKSQSANFDSGQPQLSYMILTKYSSVYTRGTSLEEAPLLTLSKRKV